MWLDTQFIYVYPCNAQDRITLTTNYANLNLVDPQSENGNYPMASFTPIAYDQSVINTNTFISVLEIQELAINGTTFFHADKILSLHHNIMTTDIGYNGASQVLLIYNNIIYGGMADCPANIVYILNNSISGSIACNSAETSVLIRGNVISNGNTLISLVNPTCVSTHTFQLYPGGPPDCTSGGNVPGCQYCAQVYGGWPIWTDQTYLPEGQCQCEKETGNVQYCYYCAACTCFVSYDNGFSGTHLCDIITSTCETPQSSNCVFLPTNGIYYANCPGWWNGTAEHNYIAFGGQTPEFGMSQFTGGPIIRYNEWSNSYPGQPTYQAPCFWNGAQTFTPYRNGDICIYLNTNETTDTNILINCTSAGMYTYSPTERLINNLHINSATPFSYLGILTWIANQTYHDNQRFYYTDFFTPLNNPMGGFPYCPLTTNLDFYTGGYGDNQGKFLLCVGFFDILNTSQLLSYQVPLSSTSFSQFLSPYQSLVINNFTFSQVETYWGPYANNDMLISSTFNGMTEIYDQSAHPGPSQSLPPLELDLYFGQNTCNNMRDNDLFSTRNHIAQIRAATEINVTNALLSFIPNTYLPLIWPPSCWPYGPGLIFLGQFPFEVLNSSLNNLNGMSPNRSLCG